MGRGTSRRLGRGRGTLGEVRVGLRDPQGGPGPIGGPSGRSEMDWENLVAVRNGSADPLGGLERVGGTSGRSRTGPANH